VSHPPFGDGLDAQKAFAIAVREVGQGAQLGFCIGQVIAVWIYDRSR
jgi:hypothetical protein